ncbi:hypothetical protein CK203_101158 [Vitis vinifera]|uniref:Reverse transcriptase zinc-binding domain-containing protein n=1 Tax=Vitis vinifera TaxID=29760 RepID=A0A438EDX2_VITVI|nr:hypothetical protein CK203_101158 [Vitis vinifera]
MGSRNLEKVEVLHIGALVFQDLGVEIVETILMQIQDTRVKRDYEDKSVWKLNKGRSSLKNTIIVFELAFGDLFPVKEVWDSWAPPKVGFALAWEAFWAKIMTLDQLRRRDRTIAT